MTTIEIPILTSHEHSAAIETKNATNKPLNKAACGIENVLNILVSVDHATTIHKQKYWLIYQFLLMLGRIHGQHMSADLLQQSLANQSLQQLICLSF